MLCECRSRGRMSGLGPALWAPHPSAGWPGHALMAIPEVRARGHRVVQRAVSYPRALHWPSLSRGGARSVSRGCGRHRCLLSAAQGARGLRTGSGKAEAEGAEVPGARSGGMTWRGRRRGGGSCPRKDLGWAAQQRGCVSPVSSTARRALARHTRPSGPQNVIGLGLCRKVNCSDHTVWSSRD